MQAAAPPGATTCDMQRACGAWPRRPRRSPTIRCAGELARLVAAAHAARAAFAAREAPAPCRIFGDGLEAGALQQMRNACQLPVAVAGALMPDAHLGYGLPIGGVLATDNAVIPYAVGVDIACRMKLTVLDLPGRRRSRRPARAADAQRSSARRASASARRSSGRRQHDVMDDDWTRHAGDRAAEGQGLGAARHERQRQPLRRVRRARRCSTRRSACRRASTSRCSATRAAAAPGAQVAQHYSQRRARAAPGAAEGARAPRVARSRQPRPARSTGRRWS